MNFFKSMNRKLYKRYLKQQLLLIDNYNLNTSLVQLAIDTVLIMRCLHGFKK